MRVLRPEPVVEHVHRRPAGDADLSGQPAVGPRGAEYIGAAVQVQDGPLGAGAFGDDPVTGSAPEGFLSTVTPGGVRVILAAASVQARCARIGIHGR